MSGSLGVQFYTSSVGSAPTQASDSGSYSIGHPQFSDTASNETTSQFHDDWITSFLSEVTSILPYQPPPLQSVSKDARCEKRLDWEELLCQISQPLLARFEDDIETLRALRLTSSEFRKTFSWGVRSLKIRECYIEDVVDSLIHTFKNVRTLHVTRNLGRIPRSLRKCVQLRELSIEPVNLGHRHQMECSFISPLTNLESLKLWGPIGCTSKAMESFGSLLLLKTLSLGSTLMISGRDLVHISPCLKLECLQLRGCHSMDDTGLIHIGKLTQLKELELSVGLSSPTSVCRVSPRGIHHLSQLQFLKSLKLGNFSSFTSRHLIQLSSRTTLTELSLDFPRAICSMDFTPLSKLTRLVHLRIRNVLVIDDHSVQVCRELTQLEFLHLGTCTLTTDASASLLSILPHLRDLRIDEYPLLTETGLETLIESPSLTKIKITGIYSITNEEVKDLALNNSFSLDSDSWSQQTINIHKTKPSIRLDT